MCEEVLSQSALSPGPMTRAALSQMGRVPAFAVLGLAASVVSLLVPHDLAAAFLGVFGLTFLALVVLTYGLRYRYQRSRQTMYETVASLVAEDAAPSLTTDIDGEIGYANRAARERFGARSGGTIASLLDDKVAQPASILYRLQNKAMALGAARKEIPVRGDRLLISVHRIGRDGFLWRLDDLGAHSNPGHAGESIGVPMMTVSQMGTILFMNDPMRRLLGGRETSLDRVFTDLPLKSGEIQTLRSTQGALRMQVFQVALSAGRCEVYLLPEPARPIVAQSEWGVVETLPVPILKLDRAGRIAMSNLRARRLLGVKGDDVGHLSDLVEGLGRPLDDWLNEAWTGRNLGRTETVLASKRDQETFVQISLERVREEQGDALIVVLNDATELKTLENQFVQSQKMQAIGQLAGGVAHDFNNVLTAISGHCDLLLMRHEENDQDYADLTQISQNANRAAALVGQLLAFSRKQHLRPDVIDLSDSMSDLSHLLGRLVGEKITLDFQQDQEVRPIRADKRKLEQVIMNLVVNARDAMPEGGKIRLDVRNINLDVALERDHVRVPDGDYVTVRVVDEGQGIPADKLERIFEPFFTTKGAGKGTGLGLSMAYGIVKQSGGYIFVDSVVGSGTTFTLYFPVHRASDAPMEHDAVPTEPPTGTDPERPDKDAPNAMAGGDGSGQRLPNPTHDPSALRGGNVLLVEDEAPVRAFASRALRLRGYSVMEAENAEAALRLLSDPEVEVDVVVTDVVMPGMDGPTWVAKALEDRPGVRVVFVSGYSEDSVSEHQKRIPNSVFLPKPFSLSELTATVSAQIH